MLAQSNQDLNMATDRRERNEVSSRALLGERQLSETHRCPPKPAPARQGPLL